MKELELEIRARMELANRRTRIIIEKETLSILKNYGFILSYEYIDDFNFVFITNIKEFEILLSNHRDNDNNNSELRDYVIAHNQDCANEIDALYNRAFFIFKLEVKKLFGNMVYFSGDVLQEIEEN